MNEAIISTNFSTSFRINRLIDRRLFASTCDISLELHIDPDADQNVQHLTLTNIKYWSENVLNDSVAFSVQNEIDCDLFGQIENHVMFCPDEPHDFLLLALITAKINAIGSGIIHVQSAMINSDTNHGFSNVLTGDPNTLLPDASEWMGDVRYWKDAWWNRPDGGMMDIPVDGENPEIKPDILVNLHPKSILESDDQDGKGFVILDESEPDDSGKIIRPNFSRTKKK